MRITELGGNEMKRTYVLNSIRKIGVIAILATLVFIGNTASNAGKKDTPDDVIRVGKNASAGLSEMQAALKAAQVIAARLQDPEVAARVLDLAKRSDREGLAELLKGEASASQIRVESIADFHLVIEFFSGLNWYQLCIGNEDCEHPSGAKGWVVFQQGK
jgi:hypothetical protein